jgi:hypothetical protein
MYIGVRWLTIWINNNNDYWWLGTYYVHIQRYIYIYSIHTFIYIHTTYQQKRQVPRLRKELGHDIFQVKSQQFIKPEEMLEHVPLY